MTAPKDFQMVQQAEAKRKKLLDDNKKKAELLLLSMKLAYSSAPTTSLQKTKINVS